MGCLKLTYDQQREPSPFLGVWKRDRLKESQSHFFEVLDQKRGQQKNCINYYPFGLTFNESKRTASVAQRFKYNNKELQEETGWYHYGVRFYDPSISRFTSIDPLSEIYYEWSPYNYVGGNPVKRTDEDGAFWNNVIGGIVGAAVEYGTQVAVNYASSKIGSDAWTDVDVGDIVVSGVEGAITSGASVAKNLVKKAAIIGASEVIKATLDIKQEGVTIETDATKIATDAAVGIVFAAGGSEAGKALVNASSDAAVKSAKSGVTAANKNLNKAVNAVQNGDVRAKSTTPKVATDNLTNANNKLSTTQTLNSTLGANKVTQEGTKAVVDYTGSVSGTGATEIKDEIRQ
ncbi:MAG: RHS repeat-associated core domain-containing protein [Bacteroidota bacterium]